jgi:hypothetical protein
MQSVRVYQATAHGANIEQLMHESGNQRMVSHGKLTTVSDNGILKSIKSVSMPLSF